MNKIIIRTLLYFVNQKQTYFVNFIRKPFTQDYNLVTWLVFGPIIISVVVQDITSLRLMIKMPLTMNVYSYVLVYFWFKSTPIIT